MAEAAIEGPSAEDVLGRYLLAGFLSFLGLALIWAAVRPPPFGPAPPVAETRRADHPRCFPEWTIVTRPGPFGGDVPMFSGCPDDLLNQRRDA